MTRRTELTLFWAAVVMLLIAHMFGFNQNDRPLALGWMPIDLLYRVVWITLAAALVFWMTARLWPNRD